jgi:hypothetical protein
MQTELNLKTEMKTKNGSLNLENLVENLMLKIKLSNFNARQG